MVSNKKKNKNNAKRECTFAIKIPFDRKNMRTNVRKMEMVDKYRFPIPSKITKFKGIVINNEANINLRINNVFKIYPFIKIFIDFFIYLNSFGIYANCFNIKNLCIYQACRKKTISSFRFLKSFVY